MRRGRWMAAWVLATALSGLAGAPAHAGSAPALDDEVTDEVGALGGDEAALRERLREVRERDGVHLFALYTDTTGGSAVTDYADETAAANSLGGDDALLVVALDDRSYALWVSDALTGVSDADIDRVLAADVEPRLADGDYAGAAVAAAEGLADAGGGAADEPAGERGGAGAWPVLLLLAGAALLVFVGVGRLRERRGLRRAAEERDRSLRTLAREANALLLASDEAVRAARQESGYAEAEFGTATVQPFRDALEAAREELRAAFALRQTLDDDIPETPDERERLLRRVVGHTERVDALLAAQRERLEGLRDLERNAPALLEALPDRIAGEQDRLEAAHDALGGLQKVAARSASSVDGNLVEAGKQLAAAGEATERGRQALGGPPGATVEALREAQDALAQAGALVEAVEHLAAAAGDAERDLDAALDAARADVDAAARALAEGGGEGLDADVSESRALLEQARREATAGQRDVLEAYRLATRASAAADGVLAAVRAADERRAREREAAEQALRTAGAAVERASDYLATRRRGIGPQARTRLEEADRHLGRARSLLADDAAAAAGEARTAEALAAEAYRLAQRDFEAYDRYQGPFGRGPFGGGWGRGRTVIIGGFPVPIGGSTRGGGGRGGSTWGSPGGGRSRGGGFGGGRSMGGGFGGGRSRGGRF